MIHTKFQGHRSIGSGEEDFLRFLPYMYMGMAAMLVMLPRPFEQLFFPEDPGGCILIWLQYALWRSRLKLWTDGRIYE